MILFAKSHQNIVPSVEDWSGFALHKRDKNKRKLIARAKFTEGKKHTNSAVEKLLEQLATHFTARSYKQNPTRAYAGHRLASHNVFIFVLPTDRKRDSD